MVKSNREKKPLSSPVHEVRNSGADAMFWRLFESFCGCVTHCFSARALCCRYFFQASVFSIRPLSRCLFKFHVGDKKVKEMKNYQINGTLSHFLSRFAFFPHLIFLERKLLRASCRQYSRRQHPHFMYWGRKRVLFANGF